MPRSRRKRKRNALSFVSNPVLQAIGIILALAGLGGIGYGLYVLWVVQSACGNNNGLFSALACLYVAAYYGDPNRYFLFGFILLVGGLVAIYYADESVARVAKRYISDIKRR